jgi:transcriptional regulator with XRE-family HTH domain
MQRIPIGQRIEQRLSDMDRDQKWLARRIGKSPSTVSRWLNGSRQMTVHELRDVSLGLHRDPSYFLDTPVEEDEEALVLVPA